MVEQSRRVRSLTLWYKFLFYSILAFIKECKMFYSHSLIHLTAYASIKSRAIFSSKEHSKENVQRLLKHDRKPFYDTHFWFMASQITRERLL